MNKCVLCGRKCGTDRNISTGFCGQSDKIKAARAGLHMWEEPCISGKNGSGTIFFTGCVLGCVFCQNNKISNGNIGKIIDENRLAEIFFELREKGAHNINLVTPTQFIPQIAGAVIKAKNQKFDLPFVYNTGSYECVDSLKMLDGLIDIYLPDFKYYSDEPAKKYSKVNNYFEVADAAVEEMVRQRGECIFDKEGMMKKGTIIRHLVLPGGVKDSKKVIYHLHNKYGNRVFLSIMNQYTPMPGIEKEYPELGRKITRKEYDEVVDFAIDIGVENGFIQEGGTAKESFIPDFDMEGI